MSRWDAPGGPPLELVYDEYCHMLERVAPWLSEETDALLRPLLEWTYARHGLDAPWSAFSPKEFGVYRAEVGAPAELAAAVDAVHRFALQAGLTGGA